MGFWISRLLYLGRLLARLHRYYSPNDDLMNYDRERELDEQFCPVQSNGNKHCAGVKVAPQNENADGLGENDKKGARGIGFQLMQQNMPNSYYIF